MKLRRWIRRLALGIATLVAIVVIALVALLTVDLGPTLRERAEVAGSKLIERPMHIGRLGIRLRSGNFVVEDLRIEGVTPADHPCFTAKRIEVSLYWWTFFRTREVLIKSIDMSDWDMQVELKDGHDSFIKIPKGTPGAPKRSFTVTLARVDAIRGRFTYIDHGTWSTVSPGLFVHVDHESGEYRGRAAFANGTVKIKDYEPMRDAMRCAFTLDGAKVHLNWIDLTTDGSHSVVAGDVDFDNWPEMLFRVRTDHVDFPRMRDIFFAQEKFRVTGDGRFTGTFHLYKGGRDLKGSFTSPLLTINDYRFPDLSGALRWLPDRFDITNGAARFHGGTGHFTYSMGPLGAPQPAVARFDTAYQDVDLASLTDSLKTAGLRLAGRASGRNILEWPLGRFFEHRGEGQVSVQPPSDAQLSSRTSAPLPQRRPGGPPPPNVGAVPNLGYLPIAGTLRYQYGPEWVDVGASSIATPSTYAEFSGRTAYGDRSSIDFYARSGDWEESDRLLAAVITAFGSPTHTVAVGGYGEFTGRMLNGFKRPRIEGTFTGEEVRAFDVVWGRVSGSVVVDNGYVDVTNGVVTKGTAAAGTAAELRADGRFSLSTPRDDGGEEINARVFVKDWPILDLRHAFDLDAYPIDGRTGGEYHVSGAYRRPVGYGRMTITDARAYGEPFERGTGALTLEGVGVRIDSIAIAKGPGTVTGAAYVSWDGKYSFNADGGSIPVEQVAGVKYANAPPLSGVFSFKHAHGAGSFASPSYDVEQLQIADLFVGDEGIGLVTGALGVHDQAMAFNLDVVSKRLNVSGAGRISLAPGAQATMLFRVTDTSLDPYIRTFEPGLSPFTSAIASGTIRVAGQLTDLEHLLVEASVERLEMRLFDYRITNEPGQALQIVLDNNVVHLSGKRVSGTGDAPAPAGTRPPMTLVGEDTSLQLSGDINLRDQRIDVNAVGDANLGILQGFFPDIRSSGRARLSAQVQGPMRDLAFTGKATISGGRIRYSSLPHAIDVINGPVTFTAGAIWFGDPLDPRSQLTAQVGGGPVTFSGRIDLTGMVPARWDIRATATGVHLRYPEGFSSLVAADLSLVGPYGSPVLKGTVEVRSAEYAKEFVTPGLLDLATSAGGIGTVAAAPAGSATASAAAFPLRFDIHITAPSSLRVQNNLARMTASADLTLRGTYDHPLLTGGATIDRGNVTFEGKRYLITLGRIEFNDSTKIDPVFDLEAETRVRVPGQTYIVNLRAVGTLKKMAFDLASDPPLPPVDVLSILFGNVRSAGDVQNAELYALQKPNATEQQIISERMQQFVFNSLSYNVGRVFEKAFNLQTFQLTPSLFDEFQRLNPSARLTIGKQISNRAYLTISRSLYAPQEDIIYVLEYDQSDRMSWVLSRNEDKTYALDVRVRHVF